MTTNGAYCVMLVVVIITNKYRYLHHLSGEPIQYNNIILLILLYRRTKPIDNSIIQIKYYIIQRR